MAHRSQLPRGLRRGAATARLLGLWVRILSAALMCVCCQVEVSASGRSFAQVSPTNRDVPEYNIQSLDNKSWAHWGCRRGMNMKVTA